MRVISGSAKGRILGAPKGTKIRPTSDRVKEAIFNTLAPFIVDSNFLDLFAGTGNMGIEALSRGARHCTFVDSWAQSIKYIRANISMLSFENKCTIIKSDVLKFLERDDNKYNIIFLDPPYNCYLINPILENLHKNLLNGGIVVVESENTYELPLEINNLNLVKKIRYGDTQIGYYQI